MANWDESYKIEKARNWKEYIEDYCERSNVPYFIKYNEYYNLIRYMGLKLDIKERDTVLDDGCGAGYPKEILDGMGLKYESYIGIDISKVAIQRMKERKVSENALLICGDACRLPLIDSSVDKVFSYVVMDYTESRDEYAKEVSRVLKKNGKGLIVILNSINLNMPYYLLYPLFGLRTPNKPYTKGCLTYWQAEKMFKKYFSHVIVHKKGISAPPYIFYLSRKYIPFAHIALSAFFGILNRHEIFIEKNPILNQFCRMLIIEVSK